MKPQVHPSPSSADRCPWRIGRILLRTGLAAAWGMATGPGFAATHSGRVADVDGSGVEGVTVRYEWSGSPGSVTTAANGNWSSSGWGPLQQARWRASMSGYTFEPNPTVWYTTPLIGNITGINFTRYTGVSGRVLRDGAGLSGVRVGLSGPAGRSDETGADGAYNFKQLGTGAYTITPSRPGTIFEPPSRAVTLGTNRSVPDFVVRLPSILTLPATNVGFGDAVLRGTVEGAGGQATTVWFEHGRVGGPLTSTPAQTLPAASATVQFSEAVTGLPGGSQEFRLVGVNASGTNRSAPGHFVMPYPAAGSAVRFNGTDAYVQVGSNPILRLTNSLTLEAWILATGPGNGPNGTGGIIVNREGEYEIARFADGTIRYALAPASGGWDWVNTGVAVPLHVWTHVALTYDPAAASAQLRLFLNGEPRFATNRTGVIGDTDTGRNDFRIGSRQGAVQHFQGQMDEVRVWNVARTAAEIQGGYRRRLAGTEGGLLASFRFDEASGTTTTDHGPNRLGATLVGASFAPSGAEIREPVVRTLEASPVLATRATLHARVNPSDAVTGVYFEYGETPAYGRRTDAQPASLPGGLKELPVGAEVADLQPGTTYHFRAVAFNEFGAVPGPGRSFRTLVLGVGWPTSAKVTGGWSDAPKHVVDAEGSAYVAGRFAGSLSLRGTLTAQHGTPDGFVGKLGRGADWLWANQVIAHAGSSVAIQAIAVDAARNVHVAGAFSGTVSLGTNQFAAPAGSTNLFVAKLDGPGDRWLWAHAAGAAGRITAVNALAVTPAGEVQVAGQFGGSITLGTNALTATGAQEILVARLDADGGWLWARRAGGTNAASVSTARAVALSAAGDVFLTGSFQGAGAPFGGFNLGARGTADLFVARLSPAGQWVQARRAGGTGVSFGAALAVEPTANPGVYVLGQFGGRADYDGANMDLNEGGGANLFVLRLSADAGYAWYAQAGAGTAESIALAPPGLGPTNWVYVAGEFNIATRFAGGSELVSSGGSDVFVARLDAERGDWGWARRIGAAGTERRGSVGVDGQGGVVVSGTFQGTVPVGHVLLSTGNERDIFLARLEPDGTFEHNNYVVGQPVPVPVEAQDPGRGDGGALGRPEISIIEREHPDSDSLNSFIWSLAERRLYSVRPVTAILKWPLTTDPTNTTGVATVVGRARFPAEPQIHVAEVPVPLEPEIPAFPFRFLSLEFTTVGGAGVDPAGKVFHAPQPGWSVLHFLDSGGELPNPALHPSRFEVVRTVPWDDRRHLLDDQPATIGQALSGVLPSGAAHQDPTGRNGHVFFERAFYDGAGEDRAHDRATRRGPIIPVNRDTGSPGDDLVVVWYATNAVTGLPWPSRPVRYVAQWPASPGELVLASGAGSGVLPPQEFPDKRVYNQPDRSLSGFNPNEEHAALYGDTLYALRNDLNDRLSPRASEPYTLLKHRDPVTREWTMKVYRVLATNAQHQFVYEGEAGKQLQPPAPLSLLPLCGASNSWSSGPGFQDHLGRLHARAAGPAGSNAVIVARYFYPLQPGFFHDFGDGANPPPVGACVPWLDRRPGGEPGTPVEVTYHIRWPDDVPTLQIGETLFGAKFGLPDLRRFARATVLFDEGDPDGRNALGSLVRLFDPLAPRVLQLRPDGATDFSTDPGHAVFRVADAQALFAGLATANDAGLTVFTSLPYTLRARLRYDAPNRNLIFRGLLDEGQEYGGPDNPLLLLNVLSPRERERLKDLNRPALDELVDALYDLTRNPSRLDLDNDGEPDPNLLVGLTEKDGRITTEDLGDGPKILSAGQARAAGYVTVVENDDPALGGLPVTLHVLRVEGGPVRGDLKVVQSDNVFDEKLTLRHSADFGGEPQNFSFEWFYRPAEAGTDPGAFPTLRDDGEVEDLRGWTRYVPSPPGVAGVNDITLGDGGESSLLVLADNWFVCRHRGYSVNGQMNWSDWVGVIGGGQAQLAEGWVKRVRDGLNPFEARTRDFHANETVTFASMLQQAGRRYEGDIAFNPGGGNINQIGLIEAYETVLRRARRLSIEGVPEINYQPANDALLLAAGFIADLYFLLGNEAVADAADPTIGFRTSSAGYGTLAPSIFTFQNQLDSLLEEEIVLLRGRDDRSATVRAPPVYNRLFWNFTRDEGEVAYAQAYNITDQNGDGFINATDARIMFPQGHGDAWGHYLTATKAYYGLLQNRNFEWLPRSEHILLAGVPQEVDYLDERKFARAAAAKARVGAEVVDLTYRRNYVDDPAGQYQGYKDTDPERAWGVSEWAHRAGSAAFLDWVLANAVLPAVDPNPAHTGISKVDRTTVPELGGIIAAYESVQGQVDKADAGLNPLGLAKNVVPFDMDPSLIAAGKTHFEQIYDRALQAVNNTVAVFNHANQLSQALRGMQDSVNDFSRNVAQQERDYKNRMIEIFGYPYAGDIGPGRTYPSGYDGPDLYHYAYVNAVALSDAPVLRLETNITAHFTPLNHGPVVGALDFFFPGDLPASSTITVTQGVWRVAYPLAAASYGLVAPPEWGQRRAPGEVQQALSELLQSQIRLKQAQANYDAFIRQVEDSAELLEARYGLIEDVIRIRNRANQEVTALRVAVTAFKVINNVIKGVIEDVDELTDITTESLPKVLGLSNDATAPARGLVKFGAKIGKKALRVAGNIFEGAAEFGKTAQEDVRRAESLEIEMAQFEYEVQQQLRDLEQRIRQEPALRLEALALQEVVFQNVGRYQAAVARGLRLLEERVAFRRNAAADTQASRYQDMTFRIFRNDAIQKYRAQFDLAAQYVFLAAVAYDYETQLLGGRTGAGQAFLTDIVRQRALGEVINGTPVAGRHGLADPLARLSQNFGVLKGQLGFNNPQTETGRFSLRRELLRLRDTSDDEWRAQLQRGIVPNLWDLPEFRRHCRPFAPESAGPQPGLVLRFPTTVTFGLNYFGWPLGGGDSAYDPTLFATKVRSAGVWFSDYDGSGLSVTPRVYLVPAGADVMRSPSGNNLETREWRVVDQKIPVPFPIGFSSLNNAAWIPMNDSLSDTFADIRRFSSFRAYHDSGFFDPAETITDTRLIGRSVWNTEWLLIIPGGTFLFDSNEGLEAFIHSVGDIKIFFQTYAYSGN